MGMRKFWSVALPFSKVACGVVLLSGMRQIAVTYGNLPSRDGKLPSRVAAALA